MLSRFARNNKHTVFIRAVPFLLFVGFLMLGTLLKPGEGNGLGAWVVLARGGVVALALFWFWPSYTELRQPQATHPGHWLMAAATGLAVFVLWIALGEAGATIGHAAHFAPLLADGSLDWPRALLRLAGLAIVVPIMEELFWRSLVLRWIRQHEFMDLHPRQAGLPAFAITTALFAVEHDMWIAGAVAGMVYNGLYMRTGNLWVPIVSHAVTNGALGIYILATRSWHLW